MLHSAKHLCAPGLSLLAALAVTTVAGATALPPDGPMGFFVIAPEGPPPEELLAVAASTTEAGRFWAGQADRSQLNELVALGLAPVYKAGASGSLVNDSPTDTDGDGLSNDLEAIYHTDPNNPDTDQDFLSDGDEVNTYGTWPLRESSDGDRYDDGQEILGFSPYGLGQLGGDMPGYVLAPGNGALVAAYPRFEFDISQDIEMQAREQVTVGSSTLTTETKTKTTTTRSLDLIVKGTGANNYLGNQQVHSQGALDSQAALVAGLVRSNSGRQPKRRWHAFPTRDFHSGCHFS